MASRVGMEIHRRLAEGQPPEVIARAVGRSASAVYDHRAGKCQCPEKSAYEETPFSLEVPELPSIAEITAGGGLAIPWVVQEPEVAKTPAGRPLPTVDQMVERGQMPRAWAEAAHKAIEARPAWWDELCEEAIEEARRKL